MTAAAQSGIPTAFLVDTNGVVAWVGHPMTLTDELIEAVLNGTHDVKKAFADFMAAHKEREDWQAAQIPINKFYEALQKKNWEEASASLAEAEKILPKKRTDSLRVQIPMAKHDYAAVLELVDRLHNSPEGATAPFLNEIAWRMAIDESIAPVDLARAEKIAEWADDASKHKDPMVIDTLARVRFRRDKKAEAVALQEKAVRLADEGAKANFEEVLASYKNGQLPPVK